MTQSSTYRKMKQIKIYVLVIALLGILAICLFSCVHPGDQTHFNGVRVQYRGVKYAFKRIQLGNSSSDAVILMYPLNDTTALPKVITSISNESGEDDSDQATSVIVLDDGKSSHWPWYSAQNDF